MSPKTHVILARELQEKINTYGIEVFEEAVHSIGFKLEAPTVALSMKVLAPGDQVEYLPEGNWEVGASSGGVVRYTVRSRLGGYVEVKHADGSEQRHPPDANASYSDNAVVMSSGSTLHFPE